MRRRSEIELYRILKEKRPSPKGKLLADDFFVEAGCGDHGYYYLSKWSNKGWWNYGVSLRSGWFTEQSPPLLER